jgi:hypothetical protein
MMSSGLELVGLGALMGTAVGSALGTIFDGPDRSAAAPYLCHRTSPPKLAHGRWH